MVAKKNWWLWPKIPPIWGGRRLLEEYEVGFFEE